MKIEYTLAIGIKRFEDGKEVASWWDYMLIEPGKKVQYMIGFCADWLRKMNKIIKN